MKIGFLPDFTIKRYFYKIIHTNTTMEVKKIIPEMFENAFSYPQLDTILMIEEFAKNNSAKYKKKNSGKVCLRK